MTWEKIRHNEEECMSFSPYYYICTCDDLKLSVDPYLENRYEIRLTKGPTTIYKDIIYVAANYHDPERDLENAKEQAFQIINNRLENQKQYWTTLQDKLAEMKGITESHSPTQPQT